MSSLFAGIEKVSAKNNKGEFFPEGAFLLEVKRVIEHTKQTGAKFFIAEFKVLESSNPTMPVGANGTWMETFKFIDKGLANVKNFILAAAGGNYSPEDVTEEVAQSVVGPENPLAGNKVRLVTKPNKTGRFLYHNYYAV